MRDAKFGNGLLQQPVQFVAIPVRQRSELAERAKVDLRERSEVAREIMREGCQESEGGSRPRFGRGVEGRLCDCKQKNQPGVQQSRTNHSPGVRSFRRLRRPYIL